MVYFGLAMGIQFDERNAESSLLVTRPTGVKFYRWGSNRRRETARKKEIVRFAKIRIGLDSKTGLLRCELRAILIEFGGQKRTASERRK